mgnify:CR=1 FL=1
MSQYVRWLIAEKVKLLRTKKGLTREDLSLELGFDNSYISKLEKTKINITIDRLVIIANFFDINVQDFFN